MDQKEYAEFIDKILDSPPIHYHPLQMSKEGFPMRIRYDDLELCEVIVESEEDILWSHSFLILGLNIDKEP